MSSPEMLIIGTIVCLLFYVAFYRVLRRGVLDNIFCHLIALIVTLVLALVLFPFIGEDIAKETVLIKPSTYVSESTGQEVVSFDTVASFPESATVWDDDPRLENTVKYSYVPLQTRLEGYVDSLKYTVWLRARGTSEAALSYYTRVHAYHPGVEQYDYYLMSRHEWFMGWLSNKYFAEPGRLRALCKNDTDQAQQEYFSKVVAVQAAEYFRDEGITLDSARFVRLKPKWAARN